MEVSIKELDALKRQMTVTVPAEEVVEEMEDRYKELTRQVKIKGFRPGKVPLKVVKMKYKDAVEQEVVSELIKSTYPAAITENDLDPVETGRVEVTKDPKKGGALEYQVTFEINPEIKLPKIETIKVDKYIAEPTDEDVQEYLEQLQRQNAEWVQVKRAAKADDRVNADYEGTIKGEAFEGGKGEGVDLELGQKRLIEDFEKGIVGMKAGDESTIKVKFPKDYGHADLAGQKAEFKIKVHKVEEVKLPELNDEFAKNLGGEGQEKFKDLEALKESLKENITDELNQRILGRFKHQALEALSAKAKFPLPTSMVDKEIDRLQKSKAQENPNAAQDVDPKELQSAAETNVRNSLIIMQFIDENEVKPDRAFVEKKVNEFVAMLGGDDRAKEMIYSNENLLRSLEQQAMEEKVFEVMLSQVKAEEKAIGFKAFQDIVEKEHKAKK